MRIAACRSRAIRRAAIAVGCFATIGALGAGAAAAEGISPIVDCIAPNPSTGNLWVYYGYVNTGAQTSIPFGDVNQVVPGIQYQGQPTVINAGVYPSVFRATFNQFAFTSIAWELGGEAAIATVDSPECSAGQTGPVSDLTPTTATLNGTVVPDGTPTVSHFDYGTSTSYGSTTPSATPSGFSSQPTSADITGLLPGTTYHYRLDATTANLATTSSDGTFTTPAIPLALTLRESLAAPKVHLRGEVSAIFTVTNTNSTYNATGVRVLDVVPADAVADLETSDPSCALDGQGRVSCAVGNLAAGASATVTVGLNLTEAARLTNVGVLTADQPSSEATTALATVEHPFQKFHG
ncbi:MAG: hypothetical protein ABSB69_05135 [Solirubrobacteraceae bacterium]